MDKSIKVAVYYKNDHVSFEEGTVIELMECPLKGIHQTSQNPGNTVVLVGMGFMGMGSLQLLNLCPAGNIVALNLSDWRPERALQPGAPPPARSSLRSKLCKNTLL